jgi:hypothetical protein
MVRHGDFDNSKIVSSHSVGSKEVVKTSLVNLMAYCRSLLLGDNPVLSADKIGLSTGNPVLSADKIGLSTDNPIIGG